MGEYKPKFMLSESEWQIVMDSLSNTIFNEELTDEARKNAKQLFLKLQKELSLSWDIRLTANIYYQILRETIELWLWILVMGKYIKIIEQEDRSELLSAA